MRCLYIQYTNPAAYPPLQHSSRILADAGWEVLFLGTGARGADALTFAPRDRIWEKRLRFQRPGWRQKLHYLWYCGWVLAHVVWWRARWVYASDLWSCPPALLASWWPGCQVLYHEHDSPAGGGGAFQRFCLWTRRRLAQRATVCVLPSEGRANVFAAANSPKRVEVVWNCPSREEVGPAKRSIRSTPTVRATYHGSISPELAPETIVEALALLSDSVNVTIVGYETNSTIGYRQRIKDKALRLGVGERVNVNPAVPRHVLLPNCHQADVGLALMPMRSGDLNMNHMAGASNKPFDYLSGGLALLVSDLPEWREMFVKPGYGLACNPEDPESIAAALRWFLEHPAEMRAMGEAGRQRIQEEWNYEARFRPVFRLINDGRA